MNNEIKEILDDLLFTTTLPNVSVKLSEEKLNQLKDYITNLQERCEYLERSNNRREDEIMSLRDECVDGETYKSRNKKAIKCIKDKYYKEEYERKGTFTNKLMNILQGENKE